MNEREQTILDMKDNLVRLQALEAHAKMFCSYETYCIMRQVTWKLEQAIKEAESNG